MTASRRLPLVLGVSLVCLLGGTWAPPAGAATVILKGTVLTPEGRPAGDALVMAHFRATHSPYGTAAGRTSATGRFSLALLDARPGKAAQVLAVHPEFAPGWVQCRPGETILVRLTVSPAAWSGVVRNAEGQPIAGAEILMLGMTPAADQEFGVFPLTSPGAMDSPLSALTDEDGRFTLPGMPPWGWLRYAVRAAGGATVSDQLAMAGDDTIVSLAREISISGRVLVEGQPRAGVAVLATPAFGGLPVQAVSGADGSYVLGGLSEGPLTVRVPHPPEGLCASIRSVRSLRAGETLGGTEISLTPGAVLSGRVTDTEEGAPVAGLALEVDWAEGQDAPGRGDVARSRGAAPFSAVTDAEGAYRVRVPAGRVALRPSRRPPGAIKNWAPDPDRRALAVQEGETKADLNFTLQPPPRIKGRVLRPDGSPAAGVKVSAPRWVERFDSLGRPNGDPEVGVKTDADGRFAIEFAPYVARRRDGANRDVVIAQDPATGEAGLAVPAADQGPVEIRLAPGAYLEGRALDAEGRGQPDVGVMAEMLSEADAGFVLPGGTTDGEGRLCLGPLPGGARVSISLLSRQRNYLLDDSWDIPVRVALAPGQRHQLPALRIDLRGYDLHGQVLDDRGRPVTGAFVGFTPPLQIATTDARGAFHLVGLPPRLPSRILAMHPTAPLFAMLLAERSDEPVVVRVLPPGAIVGQVVDADGQAVAGAQMSLIGASQQFAITGARFYKRLREAGYDQSTLVTDAEGKWKAGGLIASGPYYVGINVPNKDERLAQSPKVTVRAGETTDLGRMVIKLPAWPGPPGAGGPPPKD